MRQTNGYCRNVSKLYVMKNGDGTDMVVRHHLIILKTKCSDSED